MAIRAARLEDRQDVPFKNGTVSVAGKGWSAGSDHQSEKTESWQLEAGQGGHGITGG